jgi:hypothetical protein
MTLRSFEPKDDDAVTAMLAMEGIDLEKMQHHTWATCCAEENGEVIGFFTIRHEWGIPSLQHFCVHPLHRNGKVSRAMMRRVKELVGGQMIVSIYKGADWIKKLVESYFRTKPYAEGNGKHWYLVEV